MFPLNQSLRKPFKSWGEEIFKAFSPAALNWTANQSEGGDIGRLKTKQTSEQILQDCRHPLLFPIDNVSDVLLVVEIASYLHRYLLLFLLVTFIAGL